MSERDARPYDLVLFGATGFTGGLTAEYLARRARGERERPLAWALAGRDRGKLEAVKGELAAAAPGAPAPELLLASASDDAALARVAAATRVLATTVGPYAEHGAGVVAACVEAGTDYADITGEPAFVERMIERHDAAARARGLRLVCCCGFDSVPHDLGALLAVRQLPADRPLEVRGYLQARGRISGGTWSSALRAMAKTPLAGVAGGGGREPRPGEGGRRARRADERVHFSEHFDEWAAPMPTIDPQIVLRSARVLEDYGPDFRYGHFARVGSLPRLALTAGAVGSLFALSKLPPARRLLLALKPAGSGPSAEERAASRFRVTFLGRAEGEEMRRLAEVRGGDPGYDETAKMLAESALCLAFDRDRLPARAGLLTPAVAMGDLLVERLRAAGMVFATGGGGQPEEGAR